MSEQAKTVGTMCDRMRRGVAPPGHYSPEGLAARDARLRLIDEVEEKLGRDALIGCQGRVVCTQNDVREAKAAVVEAFRVEWPYWPFPDIHDKHVARLVDVAVEAVLTTVGIALASEVYKSPRSLVLRDDSDACETRRFIDGETVIVIKRKED